MIKGSHSWGLAGASGGYISVPHLTGQAGRRQFLSRQTHPCAHACPHTHTHPRTNPWLQKSQLQACRAGEGGGQGPHSGWQGKPSQDHTEQKSCPETHGYFNWKWTHSTLPGSQALNHHEPSLKENFWWAFPSFVYIIHGQISKRAGHADAINIRYNKVYIISDHFFKKPCRHMLAL